MSTSNTFVRGEDNASFITRALVNFFYIGRRIKVDRESLHRVPLAATMSSCAERTGRGGAVVVRRGRINLVLAREQSGGRFRVRRRVRVLAEQSGGRFGVGR